MNHIALDSQELKARVPAIFASAPAEKVSDRYTFVPTIEVLRSLDRDGWKITEATQQRVRNLTAAETTKHMISMRHPDFGIQARELGGLTPQIRIVNSHDWSSRLQIMIGIFRLVCTNGLMQSAGEATNYNVRHDHITEDLQTVMARVNSGSQRTIAQVGAWQGIQLSQERVQMFGRIAASLRFPNAEGSQLEILGKEMVNPVRMFDTEDTLWNVFNRAQEHGMRGGFRVSRRRARPISNIAANVNFNQKLWEEAEKFATLA